MDPRENQRIEAQRPQMAPQFNVPELLRAAPPGGARQEVQVPGQFPAADKLLQRIGEHPNPAAGLAGALGKMDNLQSAQVVRLADGRHQVSMRFDHGTQMPAINANVRGFRPGPTNVAQDVSFTLSHTQGGVRLDNMHGFTGSVTGPLGRVRPTWNNGMHIGKDQCGRPFVDVDSTVQGPFRMRRTVNRFGEQNFDAGSPMRQLMHNPDVLGEASNALRLFQSKDDVQRATLSKSADGKINVSAESKAAKDIELNQKVEKLGATVKSVHLDSVVSGSLSHDKDSVKFGDVKGMTVKMQTLLGEMSVTPKSFALQNDAKGAPIVRLEVEVKGTVVPIEIPVEKLKERVRR